MMKVEKSGYIHLYTGNGKGKTTAAMGLALRAAGSGMKVFIAQFVKGMHYSEMDTLNQIPETMELVMTGRYAPQELIEIADLVTEMKEIKHYYNLGIKARKGIEF